MSKVPYGWESTELPESRRDYVSKKGTASWWQKDGAWHICLCEADGVHRWTASRYDSRQESIAAIKAMQS